ncbi:MAG TPA: hypothetical protein VM513_17090 [Kofleriaceae bacterium]|nr:hypothetical protein [Kofleriaceae bacterium]
MTLFKTILSTALLASLTSNAGCGSVEEPPAEMTPDAATPDAPEPALFEVGTEGTAFPIMQGTSADFEVRVFRREGITGAVEVTMVGLPSGVTAEPLTIAADASSGIMVLHVDATAPHSLPTQVAIRGTIGTAAAQSEISVTVIGPPGSLDTSFAGGRVMLGPGGSDDYGYAVAVQADGKVVVAGRSAERLGDFALIRLERDGQLDLTFGDNGRVLTDFAGKSDEIHAIALQPDGKIVAAGVTTGATTSNDFALARYLPNGTLDPDFGNGGKVMTVLGNDSDNANALVLQADGKIVVGGDSNRGASQTGVDFALVRYLPSGALDTGFGDQGISFTAINANGARDSIYALALQTIQGEERILAAGGEGDFSVVRYDGDGFIDNTFNFDSGMLSNIFGSTIGAARAITLTPSGSIVLAGQVQNDVALVQLDDSGHLDPLFGTGGKVITKISTTNWDAAQAVTIDSLGKIVVAGWVYEGASSAGNFALLRYLTDGTLDPAFGGTGIVVTAIAAGTKSDQGMAVAIQNDERVPTHRIIVAGSANNTNSDFAIARFWR